MASNRNSHPTNAAGALERLGRLSLRQLSMESLLQAVADLSKTVMPGNPETSVLLLVKVIPPPSSPPTSSPSTSTRDSTNAATGPACTPHAPAS